MRSSKSRSRSKSNRQRTLGNVVNRVFDSSGPEGKVRGTPQQIIEKYLTLARDAQLSHDRVAEQSFLQHAEHYTRMLGEANKEMAERQGRPEDDGYQSNIGSHGYHQGNQSNGQNGQQSDGNQRRDHQPRDGQRDNQQRDHQPRDNNQNRDQQPRDFQSRDGQRDHQPRDQQPRDQQPREHQPRDGQRDHQSRDQQPGENHRRDNENRPRTEHRDAAAPEVAQQPSLPEVLTSREEDVSVPVSTPETEVALKPARTRRPRAPRTVPDDGTATPAPAPTRSRRKPVPKDDAAAPAPVRPEGDQD